MLSVTNDTPSSTGVRELLTDLRERDRRDLRMRLDRAVSEGELPAAVDTATMTAFVMTVLHGLSIQARDGASGDALDTVVDTAMLAWDHTVQQTHPPD